MKILLTGVLIAFTITAGVAQTNFYHNIVWGRLVLTDTINARLRWELMIQHRRQNVPDNEADVFRAPQFSSYAPWLHYTLSPTLKFSVSPIGYFENWTLLSQPADLAKVSTRELRVVARLDQEQKLGWLNLMNRYTLERRWRDAANTNVFQPNWRVRYMLRLEKPIRAAWLKRPLSVVLSDELMVQFGYAVRGNPNVFDQNRLYGGVNVGLSRSVKASLGYLWTIQERPSGKEFDYVLTFDNVLSQFKKKKG
jgi:hypothetical protein